MSRSSIKSDFAALEEDRSTADAALLGAVTAALGIAPTKPKRGPGSSSPEPFWKKRGGLLLRDVWYDPKEDVFVVTFEAGATYRVPLAKVPHRGIVFAVALDEFRHGVNIACADGTSTTSHQIGFSMSVRTSTESCTPHTPEHPILAVAPARFAFPKA